MLLVLLIELQYIDIVSLRSHTMNLSNHHRFVKPFSLGGTISGVRRNWNHGIIQIHIIQFENSWEIYSSNLTHWVYRNEATVPTTGNMFSDKNRFWNMPVMMNSSSLIDIYIVKKMEGKLQKMIRVLLQCTPSVKLNKFTAKIKEIHCIIVVLTQIFFFQLFMKTNNTCYHFVSFLASYLLLHNGKNA